MRLGLTELLLIVIIALLALGPGVSRWLNRWSRQAKASRAAEARRRAAWEAERKARRDFILHRFQIVAAVFAAATAVALVYTLGLRPIEAAPQSYTVPAAASQTAAQTIEGTAALPLEGYQPPDCIVVRDGWIYMAARPAGGSGSTLLTGTGGALCRLSHDDWGASAQQVVTQIDGRPLAYPAAVAAGAGGEIYFTEAAGFTPKAGTLEEALRAELVGHTATGWVYVYDPAGRSVQRVLGGLAGAPALAVSPDGATLYAADLGSRCIWAVETSARELTAGGKGCTLFAGALPGYPGALAADGEGTVYVAYRWAEAGWLESRAQDPGLRGVAARLPRSVQQGLFRAGEPLAQSYTPDGRLDEDYSSAEAGGWALAASGNRLYLPGAQDGVSCFVF